MHPPGLENPVIEDEPSRRVARAIVMSGSEDWGAVFLAKLAETSDVRAAARAARVSPGVAYCRRREDAAFAKDWRRAVVEAYEHLELETLHRLRKGAGKDDEKKFDIASAMRLLAAHREGLGETGEQETLDEHAIFEALYTKLEKVREREENVTRLLGIDGISMPQSTGGDE